jgi:hypothetical protein
VSSASSDLVRVAELPGHSFESIKASSERFKIEKVEIHVASVEMLIEIKSHTGRPKDLLHVAELKDLLKLKGETE